MNTIELARKYGMEDGIEWAIEKGIQQGMEKGIQQGMEKGIQQGKKEVSLSIAREMKMEQSSRNSRRGR